MKVLLERWQHYISEREETGVDPQRNLNLALDVIKSEGYEHEVNKNTIKVKHDNRHEVLDTLLRGLEPLGFRHNMEFYGSSLGRIEIKDKTFGSVYILVKPKTKRAATIGT